MFYRQTINISIISSPSLTIQRCQGWSSDV